MHHQKRWTARKIEQRLELIASLAHRRSHPLPPFRVTLLSSPLDAPPIGPGVDDSDWAVIEPKTYWGDWYTNFVLRSEFQVPADWPADVPVALYMPLGDAGDFSHPEALTYIDGAVLAACDRHHQELALPTHYRDGKTHALALHGWTGLGGWEGSEPGTKLFMRPCDVVQIDSPTREFVAAARVALGVVEELDENDPIKERLLNALDAAFKLLDTRDPLGDDFYGNVPNARTTLGIAQRLKDDDPAKEPLLKALESASKHVQKLESAGDAFYDSVPAALAALKEGIAGAGGPIDVDVVAVGHAHIDVAWLWTLGQTRHKAARTFSTVLQLMEQFPEYHFTQSQPQLYKYIQEDYPELFEGISQRIEEGRWEILGGSWVEPDCNESGAESLARQFLLGRTYFRDHFGDVETPVFWLPDTFGYPWALPQLIKLAGLDYFITHKMSWNQYNRMPYQSFWWQGIDGTQILTHFMTTRDNTSGISSFLPYATTYNGDLSPNQVMDTWNNYLHKEAHSELMTAYGYGDGGGGPTREMLENGQQMANHPGTPRVRGGTVREFLENLKSNAGDRLPTWYGELYFEYHRGTYTSQARTKRNNRKSEFLLHDAEFLAALATLTSDYAYPRQDLNQAWELVCLNQFHDILPGSSITPVYVDSQRDYDIIRSLGEKVQDGALAALSAQLPAGASFLAANPTSFGGNRIGLLDEPLPDGAAITDLASGQALLTQPVSEGTLVEVAAITPYSVMALGVAEGAAAASDGGPTATLEADGAVLENDALRVEFDAAGDITRIFDKSAGREVLPEGAKANELQAFEDRPLNFEAWDIDIFFDDKQWTAEPADSVTVIEGGPLRAGLEIKRRLGSSEIVQRVFLYRNSQRLDFDTWIDWHEQHILLKAAFPTNVLSPTATYDIQWGNIERPTHHNTSWDWARFENAAYKWVDLSESNYGVSVLNDCKYGHDIRDNVIRVTLLKSATSPDPVADQGEHRVTYSLFPHEGDWRGGTVPASYDLNDPLIMRRVQGKGDRAHGFDSLVAVDASNVIVETVKQAEDGRGIIVRLYENERARKSITLRTGFPLAAAHVCNLLEQDESHLEIAQNAVTLNVTPYQIVTLRLIPA